MKVVLRKNLESIKAAAKAKVDTEAERQRSALLTPGEGQAMAYWAKQAEAARFLALDAPPHDLSGFPFIQAEIGVTAGDATTVAQLWLSMAAEWAEAAARIEQVRLAAKTAISAATTPANIEAASSPKWPH